MINKWINKETNNQDTNKKWIKAGKNEWNAQINTEIKAWINKGLNKWIENTIQSN